VNPFNATYFPAWNDGTHSGERPSGAQPLTQDLEPSDIIHDNIVLVDGKLSRQDASNIRSWLEEAKVLTVIILYISTFLTVSPRFTGFGGQRFWQSTFTKRWLSYGCLPNKTKKNKQKKSSDGESDEGDEGSDEGEKSSDEVEVQLRPITQPVHVPHPLPMGTGMSIEKSNILAGKRRR
jgi:hypothetical protein